jgi:hypothetical protein
MPGARCVRDDRDPPRLSRRDSAEITSDLGGMESGIFFARRLDDPNQPEIIQQIAVCAQRYWEPSMGGAGRKAALHVQVVFSSSKVACMRISDDLRKPSRSLQGRVRQHQFFLADHDRVVGVRCQS